MDSVKQSNIKLLAFGIIAEKMRLSCIKLENIADSEELVVWLNSHYPQIKNLKYSIAVNKKIIQSKTVFNNEEEVALLPPFSGG